MPLQNATISSINDAIILLDKSIVSDATSVNSQINVSGGSWKLAGNSSSLTLEKKKQGLAQFSPTDGLSATSIKTPTATLSGASGGGLGSTVVLNSQTEVHHSYGAPSATDTSTTDSDQYVVALSGYMYMRYTPTGPGNANTVAIYRRVPTLNNPNSFELLIDTTFTGASDMNNSIIRGDYNFNVIFELLPFYDYGGAVDNGILRIWTRSGATLSLTQTITDATFNMTDFQVSADGNYILITSSDTSDSSFRVYKRAAKTANWLLYHSGTVGSDSTRSENVLPVAVARDGCSITMRGNDGGIGYYVIVYTNTGRGFKYETEFTRFGTGASISTGRFGSYSPDGTEFVLSDYANGSTEVYEFLDGQWREKQKLAPGMADGQSTYNGQFISTIRTVPGSDEWHIYGRKHNGLYELIARFNAVALSGNTALSIDDLDIVHYMHYNVGGDVVLTSVYPIGGAISGTAYTNDIGIITPYIAAPVSNIGSATSVYTDVFVQNGITVTSDRNLKKNITPITNSIDRINDMKPVSYKWRDSEDKKWHHGFLASNNNNIRYSEITPLLAGALQDISDRLDNIV